MTQVYFIRHAQADNSVRDNRMRPLTEKGLADRSLVTQFLSSKNIDIVFSSPFKRAVDTMSDFTESHNIEVQVIEDFRERKSDSDMSSSNKDFASFVERQWADFNYTFSDGECLAEVQERNIAALKKILIQHKGKTIAIGTHGTALMTILNYYDKSYGFADFTAMVNKLPWAVKMSFDESGNVEIEKIDLYT